MAEMNEIAKKLDSIFEKRGLKVRTRNIYIPCLLKLNDFYPRKKVSELSFEDISKYIAQLISRKVGSHDSYRHIIYACHAFYNEYLGKNYKFYKIPLPPPIRKDKDYLNQEEIIRLLNHIENKKHKAIIATIYSCYLEVNELLSLKLENVKSKQGILTVFSESTNSYRDCILSENLINILKEYYAELNPKPQEYFFEGQKKGTKYSATSLKKIIDKYVAACEINKKITPTSLRKSGIKHLTELGVPLFTILKDLSLFEFKTHEKYNDFCYDNYKLNFSPLDKIVIKPKFDEFELLDIENLLINVKNEELSDYLTEAISCLRVGALRAGVIFIWTAGIRLIQLKVINDYPLKEINSEVKKIYPKAKEIKNQDDFSFLKDEFTLQLCNRLGLYDKHEKNELVNSCLGLRNKCGHPTRYSPQLNKVKGFIEDMVAMVFSLNLDSK